MVKHFEQAAGLALVAVLALPSSAWAVDGLIEINAVRAAAGGVSGDDLPGYPVTISDPGSYVLTGDLVQSDADTYVIQVTSDHVTINLNGFSIRGSNVNEVTLTNNYVSDVSCGTSGTGGGIRSDNLFTRVRNGTITGTVGSGVRLDNHSTASDLIIQDSCGRGLEVGYHALIRDVMAIKNSSYGIYAWDRSIVESCTVSENGATGIYANRDSVVRHCTSYRNRGAGIH